MSVNLTEEQIAVASALIQEGIRAERERILKALSEINTKTVSVSKIVKIVENS